VRLLTGTWKSVAAIAAATVALTLVTACSGGGASQQSQGTQQPLQFFLSGDANQGGGFAHMAQKYQQQTGATVEIVDIANADLPTKLKSAAQANALPAMARVGAIDPVWRDLTVDLAPITNGSKIMMKLAAVTSEGKVLSIPTDVTAVGMFINKTLFDKAGVKYPTTEDDIWTWDEFVSAVNQVKKEAGTKYGMVMDRSSHRLSAFLYEFGSTHWQPDDAGQFSTNDATKQALEYFNKLNDDSFMPRSVWLAEGDGNALFKSGDVAAYMSGSWQIADFAVNIKDFEWASVYLPKQPVRATQFGNAANIVVYDGPQKQQALDFVKWLYDPANYTELATKSSFLPAIEGLKVTYASNGDAFDLYNSEIAAAPEIVSTIKSQALAYEVAGMATEGDPVRDETVKYLNGEQDVDTTIKNINEQLTSQLGPLP